jgi:ectoine hydroxylase-related dioxygenase (phytanoyl-CoA dioxygenase family)
LSRRQLAFYRENGYLVVEGFVPERRCRDLITKADKAAGGHYTNLLDLHDGSSAFRRLLTDPAILGAADQIQGVRMIPIGSIFFFCKPGNPAENGAVPHQDNYAAKAPYGSYLVCGVALDDADQGNGALVVYPGTHKLGDLPCKPSRNFDLDGSGKIVKAYPIGFQVKVPKRFAPVQLKYSRGSLLIFHGHLVHSAPKNPSADRWRRKIYLHYIKDGDPFWPGWIAKRHLIEREPATA